MSDGIEKARVPIDSDSEQPTLFPLVNVSRARRSPEDVCKAIGLNWMTALSLQQSDWLSFDLKTTRELNPWEEAELTFVGSLVKAGCDECVLRNLLSGLRKPYSYRVDRIYYDWQTRSWRLLEDMEALEDSFVDWLRDLVAWQELDLLNRMRERLENAIVYLRGKKGLSMDSR